MLHGFVVTERMPTPVFTTEEFHPVFNVSDSPWDRSFSELQLGAVHLTAAGGIQSGQSPPGELPHILGLTNPAAPSEFFGSSPSFLQSPSSPRGQV